MVNCIFYDFTTLHFFPIWHIKKIERRVATTKHLPFIIGTTLEFVRCISTETEVLQDSGESLGSKKTSILLL